MIVIFTFAVVLLIAVLISGPAQRSAISTSVFFLAAGFLIGNGALGLIELHPEDPGVSVFIELALVAVLFHDGLHMSLKELAAAWHLPGRALFLGLPLTLVAVAGLAVLVAGLPWPHALLVGAVLSPTDPVFASAVVNREEVPERLRRFLNIESGLNDGLALPFVLALLAFLGAEEFDLLQWFGELGLGLLLGCIVPWLILRLARLRRFDPSAPYRPLLGFSILLLVYTIASLLHGNLFLAAYAAGVTVATMDAEVSGHFDEFGGVVAELLKLASLLIFGALLSLDFLGDLRWSDLLFALLVLLLARPFSLWLSLLGSELGFRERITAAWFGPRGFASVVYSLLVLKSGLPGAGNLVQLIAIVIVGSIILHSSTDFLFARWFKRRPVADSN